MMRSILTSAPLILMLTLLFLSAPILSEAATETSYPRLTLWPIASHSASANESTTDILWPLLHHQRRGTVQSWQLRPGLLDYTTDAARDYRRFDALLLLTRFERTGDDFWNHIFPSYWHGSKGGDRWFHLWPLYGQWSKANGEEGKTTLWPFFQYRTNAITNNWSLDYFMPLGRNWREGEASGGQLLPLWWWRTDPQHRAGFIIPYYWDRRPGEQRDGIFPLWYRKVTPPNVSFNQLLLYLGYRSPESRYDALLPLWFDRIKGDKRLQLLLPVWFHSRSNDTTTRALLPLWFEHRNPRRSFAALAPFYLRWSGVATRLRLFVPIHGSYHDPSTDTSLWFPFYFHHRDRLIDSEFNYYFPLYGHYRRGERIDERYYLFPLYAHSADAQLNYESWNILWPLFHYDQTGEDDYQAWAMPFFWSKHSEEHRLSMALALYWASERADSGFTLFAPLYWHSYNEDGSQRHLLPFYSDMQKSDGWRKRFFLGPLAIFTDDPQNNRSQTDILWPLFSKERSLTKEHTRVLPFYWHDQTPTHRLTVASAAFLPPYYIHHEQGDEKIHHLWPFYGVYRDGDYREASNLWPLLRWGQSDDGKLRAWQVLLAFGEHNREDYSYGLVPLWMHKKKGDQVDDASLLHLYRTEKDENEFSLIHLGHPEASLLHVENAADKHHQHLFPLYSYSRNATEDRTRFVLLWPLYDYQRRGDESSSWRFLWRLMHSEKSAGEELLEFSPFFYRERSGENEIYTAYLGGLFSTLEKDGETERSLLWFLRW